MKGVGGCLAEIARSTGTNLVAGVECKF